MVKKNNTKITRRILFLGTISFIIIGAILFSIGQNMYQIYNKKKEQRFLTVQLNELKEEEQGLEAELQKLKDPDYVARYAREKYLYSKDGEFIIRIP
ncbi:MAG: septum formation initiator family protein [Bacilli bacterium]